MELSDIIMHIVRRAFIILLRGKFINNKMNMYIYKYICLVVGREFIYISRLIVREEKRIDFYKLRRIIQSQQL